MAYDAEALRVALKGLQRDRVITDKALMREYEDTWKPANPGDRISRQALGEFRRGRASIKHQALPALYDFLRQHPHYKAYLPVDAPASFEAALLHFGDEPAVQSTVSSAKLRGLFPGKYTMARRDWAKSAEPGLFRVSVLDIVEQDGGVRVTETQDFPDERPPYKQSDTGAMFTRGLHVYFLTKETGAVCVKFAVVDAVFPHVNTGEAVLWFKGMIIGASHLGIYPTVKFFCRRHTGGPLKVGRMTLAALDDAEAAAHLT